METGRDSWELATQAEKDSGGVGPAGGRADDPLILAAKQSAVLAEKESAADAAAGKALLRATGAGAAFSAAYLLIGWGGGVSAWGQLDVESVALDYWWTFAPMIVPALLILGAYLVVAWRENDLGVRQQRGALAVLVFLALIPLPTFGPFSGTYGVALLLLAIRTRETYTVVVGVLALIAWAGISHLGLGWASVPVLVLMAIAAFVAAHRVRSGVPSGGQVSREC